MRNDEGAQREPVLPARHWDSLGNPGLGPFRAGEGKSQLLVGTVGSLWLQGPVFRSPVGEEGFAEKPACGAWYLPVNAPTLPPLQRSAQSGLSASVAKVNGRAGI